jgi:hypothetical protein
MPSAQSSRYFGVITHLEVIPAQAGIHVFSQSDGLVFRDVDSPHTVDPDGLVRPVSEHDDGL